MKKIKGYGLPKNDEKPIEGRKYNETHSRDGEANGFRSESPLRYSARKCGWFRDYPHDARIFREPDEREYKVRLSYLMRMSSALTTGTPIPSSASRSTRESDTHIKVLPRIRDKVAFRPSAWYRRARSTSRRRVQEQEITSIECARRGKRISFREDEEDTRAIYGTSKVEENAEA